MHIMTIPLLFLTLLVSEDGNNPQLNNILGLLPSVEQVSIEVGNLDSLEILFRKIEKFLNYLTRLLF